MSSHQPFVTEVVCNALNEWGASITFPTPFDDAAAGEAILDAIQALRESVEIPLTPTDREHISKLENEIHRLRDEVRVLTEKLRVAKYSEKDAQATVERIERNLAGATIVPSYGNPWKVREAAR